MKAFAMNFKKLALASAALLAFAMPVKAQVANISTTLASSFATGGFNLNTGMVSAISNTYFTNDGDTALIIRGGGTPVTATIVTQAGSISQAGYGSVPLSNLVVSIPSATYVMVGPFPQGRWNTQFGTVAVSLTSVSGISLTAVSQAQ